MTPGAAYRPDTQSDSLGMDGGVGGEGEGVKRPLIRTGVRAALKP